MQSYKIISFVRQCLQFEPLTPPFARSGRRGPEAARRTAALLLGSVFLTGLLGFQSARAEVTFDVSVVDMPGAEMAALPPFAGYHDAVARHVAAAGAQWAQYLTGSATVSVQVELYPQSNLPADSPQLLTDTPMTLRERTAVVGSENGHPIVEFAAAHRIRTGQPVDASGAPDITIRIGERYLKELLYFDSDPFNRAGPVPSGKTEAFGRFVHELGHALGFNGFYRGDGTYDPVAMRSTFDRLIVVDSSGSASFVGALAMELYGGPVPLTADVRGHLGNDADPRLFDLSAAEVMNGRTAYVATRYNVSELDVRILCDIGVPCVFKAAMANAAPSAGQSQATPPPTPTLAPTSRVVEYYNATLGHYFVTSIADEIAKLDDGVIAGWSRTGESFAAFPIGSGNAPVCRFFSASFSPRSSHFYSALANECDVVRGEHDWDYEGTVFEVRLPDAQGHCAAPLVPLYRLYNNGEAGAPNHRYTTSESVRATMIGRGWTPEGLGSLGVVACVAG
jgi:hypothetical protein